MCAYKIQCAEIVTYSLFNICWCFDARARDQMWWFTEERRGEKSGTRCPVMLQKLMLSVIFLVKDNATEEFNEPIRVITERFVHAHQKKLQVVCNAHKKRIRIICPLLPCLASLLPGALSKWVIFMSEEEWRPRFVWQGHASSNIAPEGLVLFLKEKSWNSCVWTELWRDYGTGRGLQQFKVPSHHLEND